jgi:hypothetical protein
LRGYHSIVVKERLRHLGPALVVLALVALPGSALAAGTGSQTFTTTGESAFVVPAGVTSVQVTLVGGNGGPGFAPGDSIPGGQGGTALATIAVTPGETLYAEVASDGGGGRQYTGGVGGVGGGGTGGYAPGDFDSGGGGGGGASDVRTCSVAVCTTAAAAFASRLVIAGGGGGGGNKSSSDALGGPGGEAGGAGTGGAASNGFEGGGGGQAGGQTLGGQGGKNGGNGNGRAPAGLLGTGGNGQNGNVLATSFGGGGGGGLYGGGGGGLGEYGVVSNVPYNGGGGGGGGGSSGVAPGATGVSNFGTNPTPDGAEPSITFTWTLPPPAAVTGAASGITQTSATLNGTVNPDHSLITDCHFVLSTGATVPCLQQVGSGGTPSPVSASASGLTAGHTYTAALVATSAQGTSTGSPVSFTTASSPPTLSHLTVKPKRFHRGKGAARLAKAKKKKQASATTIGFQLSEAATVKLTFAQAVKGHKAHGGCTTKSKKGKRCTAYKAKSNTVSLAANAGSDKITFTGVTDGGKKLRPATYRLSVTATNAAGQSSGSLTATFTIVR